MAANTPRIDQIEGSATIAGALAQAAGVTTLVSPTKISVPYTTIVNRALIPDMANDAGVSFGVNRIPVQQIFQLQDEFGPNGEPVWGALNDDRGMIRFVGGWSNGLDTIGQYVADSTNTTDYCEITFYGTGLNILVRPAGTYNYSIDGQSEVSVTAIPSGFSSVLSARNYSPNHIVNVVSTSIGLHTVKLRNTNGSSGARIHGFEILNTSSTTSLTVKPGSAIGSQKNTLSALTTTPYNSGFTNVYGTAGTRGGRVLVYLASDGSVKKDIQYVDTAAAYLFSASHTNEEIARRLSFREFGAGRTTPLTDDFSSKVAGVNDNRAFTLDDGTTTLVATGINLIAADDTIYTNATVGSSFITITFVGTGLDIIRKDQSSGTAYTMTVSVDGGSSVGTLNTTASTLERTEKVVSGLPYGTHTVRFLWTVNNTPIGFRGFVVYQPKKPSLPTGAVELADYNVMADFVANSTASIDTVATGILRKHIAREFVYVGSWSISGPQNNLGGWDVTSATNTNYLEYTFFGTGFDFRYQANVDGATVQVAINGTNATSTNFPTATFSSYGTGSFTAGTGVINQAGASTTGSGARLSGLPLGLYAVRFTKTGGTNMRASGIDAITPVHSPKSNLLGDLQNTLTVGSQSLSDSRKFSTSQLAPQKAWAQAVGVSSAPTTSSTAAVPCPDMSVTIRTSGGPIEVYFQIYQANANFTTISIYVDGVQVVSTAQNASNTVIPISFIVPVSAGTHKVDGYWNVNAGTVTANSTQRLLKVREL